MFRGREALLVWRWFWGADRTMGGSLSGGMGLDWWVRSIYKYEEGEKKV